MKSGEHALWDAAVWEVEMAWLVGTGPTMLEALVEWERGLVERMNAAMRAMAPAMEEMARAVGRARVSLGKLDESR